MRKTLLLTLLFAMLGTGLAYASGSSGPSPAVGTFGADPLAVTEVMKCTVTRIAENGSVYIRDGEGQPERLLSYSEDTRFVAQKKKEFDGRKRLGIEDLKVGQRLRVTVRPATQEVVRVKVLKQG
ncbi:MAG: hypothetical protein MPN21_02765 [Thermoanaerobaculia bacterium]|nr:hypothetical protein [Thermoanaerobaculia bacterium]